MKFWIRNMKYEQSFGYEYIISWPDHSFWTFKSVEKELNRHLINVFGNMDYPFNLNPTSIGCQELLVRNLSRDLNTTESDDIYKVYEDYCKAENLKILSMAKAFLSIAILQTSLW